MSPATSVERPPSTGKHYAWPLSSIVVTDIVNIYSLVNTDSVRYLMVTNEDYNPEPGP